MTRGFPRWLGPVYALPILALGLIAGELPQASARATAAFSRAVAALDPPAQEPSPSAPPPSADFATLRAGFQTQLVHPGPAPQPWSDEPLPEDVKRVSYPSGPRELAGFLQEPKERVGRVPVLVYLHGGFAFGLSDLADCEPFLDAGFAVFAPTYRGENGNPGDFELFFGEVDDARAAVAWAARQPFADPERIYVFGHSIGAGVAELMALLPGDPVALSGSSGGLYGALDGLVDELPYDPNRALEKQLRTVWTNLGSVQRAHIAYLGTDERSIDPYRRALQSTFQNSQPQIEVRAMPGDHFTSLRPAMLDFLSELSRLEEPVFTGPGPTPSAAD